MYRDITKLDVRLLVAFEAMAAERNVTRAAKRAGLTQQGMSGQLARLRTVFGDPLFVRSKGGITPTPRAQELAPLVSTALRGLEPLVSSAAFDPLSFEGTITMAATDYAIALIIPPLLDRLQTAAPGLRLMIRPAGRETLEAEMRDALVDLALTVPEFTPPDLHGLHLFDENYVGVARTGHPIFAYGAVSVDAFCAYPHLLVSPFRGDASGPTDTALAAIGRRRTIGLVVPGFSVVEALIERTDLVTVLPQRLVNAMRHDLQTFDPPVRIAGFSLGAYWPRRLDASKQHQWLRHQIEEAANSE